MSKINLEDRTPKQKLAAAIRSEAHRHLVTQAVERKQIREAANRVEWESVSTEARVPWLAEYAQAHGFDAALSFADSVGFRMPIAAIGGIDTSK